MYSSFFPFSHALLKILFYNITFLNVVISFEKKRKEILIHNSISLLVYVIYVLKNFIEELIIEHGSTPSLAQHDPRVAKLSVGCYSRFSSCRPLSGKRTGRDEVLFLRRWTLPDCPKCPRKLLRLCFLLIIFLERTLPRRLCLHAHSPSLYLYRQSSPLCVV